MEGTDCSNQPRFKRYGSIEPHLNDFIASLQFNGYTSSTINGYIGSLTHFGWWCDNQGILTEEMDEATAKAFGQHRCACPGNRSKKFLSQKYLKRVQLFLEYLKKQGVLKSESTPEDLQQPMLQDFRDWLSFNRGLRKPTIDKYVRLVNALLPALGENPALYDAKKIRQVVFKEIDRCSRAQAKTIITALRSYLRYLAAKGQCVSLVDAVPAVAEWKLSSLPRYIDSDSITRLIDSCDLNTVQGVRDRAILLLLSRLGFRAGDVIGICLNDFNWSDGNVRVRGKGRADVLLPLPQDVGDSILNYIENARPKIPIDKVFLCLNAPYRAFSTSASVSDIVRLALKRAGIENPPSHGANLLRHSAATMMLRNGATLETVSAVLRHRSLDMSAYYAKVDINMLQKIAQPWPEVPDA